MPVPSVILMAFCVGLAAALAARAEIRVTPRPAWATRSFAAYASFVSLALLPAALYFYVFHGDWFLLYSVDVSRVPSAVALVGFALIGGLGALAFVTGATLVRAQRELIGIVLAALLGLAALGVPVAFRDRLARVGTYSQFHGGFGLAEFSSHSVAKGTAAIASLVLVGAGLLLARLWLGGRRS